MTETLKNSNEDVQRLIDIGQALYGERWQTDLSNALQLSSVRRVRQWLNNERAIPGNIWADIERLIHDRNAQINQALEIISKR